MSRIVFEYRSKTLAKSDSAKFFLKSGPPDVSMNTYQKINPFKTINNNSKICNENRYLFVDLTFRNPTGGSCEINRNKKYLEKWQ